jgi:hypothetical protein
VRPFRGIATVALMTVLLVSGCGSPQYRFRNTAPPAAPAGKIPMTLALVLPPSVCSRTQVVGDLRPSVFHVGESVCRDIREAGERVYRKVEVFGKTEDALARDADAVLDIRLIGLDGYVVRKVPAVVGYRMVVGWSFATRDGKSRYAKRLAAVGEDERTFGYVDPRHRASLQRCLEDLGRKASAEMEASLENGRKNLAAEEDILARFARYEAGATSLETYEGEKTGEWNVTLKERRSAAKKYPGKDGGTAGSAVVTEIYVRDEVRSAYGEDLVCEVEFEGKGKDRKEILLSSLLCRRGDRTVLAK